MILNLLSYLSSGHSIFVGGQSLAFYLIGSIFGSILTDEHRHQHEQEPLVSGVDKINMVQEDSTVNLLFFSLMVEWISPC